MHTLARAHHFVENYSAPVWTAILSQYTAREKQCRVMEYIPCAPGFCMSV